eukprot:5261180-Prymnesium_polylepis.1
MDQCVDAPVPEEAPIKSSLSPLAGHAEHLRSRQDRVRQPRKAVCYHPSGTHRPLRGVDADG